MLAYYTAKNSQPGHQEYEEKYFVTENLCGSLWFFVNFVSKKGHEKHEVDTKFTKPSPQLSKKHIVSQLNIIIKWETHASLRLI
jgi:hypothetical protein